MAMGEAVGGRGSSIALLSWRQAIVPLICDWTGGYSAGGFPALLDRGRLCDRCAVAV
jgi:hypothetical protein